MQQTESLRRKIDDLQRELAQSDIEIKAQQTRLASSRNEYQRAEDIQRQVLLESKLIEFRNNVLDQQVKLEGLKRQRASVERELSSTRAELPMVGTKVNSQIDQVKRQMSELQQGSVQEAAKREHVIRAPIAGVLTNIAANSGEAVADEAPLALVVPKGSGLHAQLLVPTRASASCSPGRRSCCVTTPSRSSVWAVPWHGRARQPHRVVARRKSRFDDGARACVSSRCQDRFANRRLRRANASIATGHVGQRRHPAGKAQGVGWVFEPILSLERLDGGAWVMRRVPMILQSEAPECGIACVAMIASYHGFRTDLGGMRMRLAPSMKGVT